MRDDVQTLEHFSTEIPVIGKLRRAAIVPRMFDCRMVCAAALLLASCTPQEGENEYRRRRQDYDTTRSRGVDSLAEVVVDSAKSEDVLKMVKEYQSPDAAINTDTWLARQLYGDPGQIMFERWDVQRRGASKYEARFTYTRVGGDNRMVKRGWSWNVDTVLKVVSPPRELAVDEQVGRSRRSASDDAARRVRAAEASLE